MWKKIDFYIVGQIYELFDFVQGSKIAVVDANDLLKIIALHTGKKNLRTEAAGDDCDQHARNTFVEFMPHGQASFDKHLALFAKCYSDRVEREEKERLRMELKTQKAHYEEQARNHREELKEVQKERDVAL